MNELTNGHTNGNGHTKIFDLAPKQDPLLASVVPAARKRVATMHKLSFGARNFFQWLTDQSLTPGSNITKGVLKISDHDAGVRFKVHSKTIRNWKRELEDTGEVWLTEKWMKNSFPQTVYNITAIVGQATLPMSAHSQDGSLADDEVFSSNRRRQQAARRDPVTGMFARRFGTPPRVATPEVSPEISQNQAETEPSEKILPPTTATDCRPPRQNGAAHRGTDLPSPTAPICRPARQNGAVADGTNLPLSAAPHCRSDGKQVAGNGKTLGLVSVPQRDKRGETTPPVEALERDFKEWESKILADAHLSTLKKWEALFVGQLQTVRTESARALVKRKLVAVRLRLHGPALPDEPKPARRVTTNTATMQKLPDEKIRELGQAAVAKMREAVMA